MKYLKYFEGVPGTIYDKEGLYEQIERDEFLNIIWDIDRDEGEEAPLGPDGFPDGQFREPDSYYDTYTSNSLGFTSIEIEKIKNILQKFIDNLIVNVIEEDMPPDLPAKSLLINMINATGIVKIRDEYFGVELISDGKYYICDQFDGLELCLKMLCER